MHFGKKGYGMTIFAKYVEVDEKIIPSSDLKLQ